MSFKPNKIKLATEEQYNNFIKSQVEDLEDSYNLYTLNSILENTNQEDFSEIFSILPKPFLTESREKDADCLSLIANRFFTHTEIPLALPIFAMFSFMSASSVKNNIRYKLPLSKNSDSLDTWTLVLSPTGKAKTLSTALIKSMIPTNLDNEKVVEENFTKPNGPAAFVQALCDLPLTEDQEGQYGLWFEDEAAQFIKVMEKEGHPMAEIREYLLKSYDHSKITRRTKAEEITTESIYLTLHFINTIDSFVSNISKESLNDGLVRRFNFVFAESDGRKMEDYALYDKSSITDDLLKSKIIDCFLNIESNKNKTYEFSKECYELYTKYFKLLWSKKYNKILNDKETFYRTAMMQSFKYAVFYHILLNKETDIIDTEDLSYGIKISMLFMNSIKKFFDLKEQSIAKTNNKVIEKSKNDLNKYIEYLNDNADIKMRDFTRKYGIRKNTALVILKSIKTAGLVKNHILFNDIKD